MRIVHIFIFLLLSSISNAQITFVNTSNREYETERKVNEAYFKGLEDDAWRTYLGCVEQANPKGSGHTHDANMKEGDICKSSNPICKAECACETKYKSLISGIRQKKEAWLKGMLQKEEDYKNKLAKQQAEALKNSKELGTSDLEIHKTQAQVQSQQQTTFRNNLDRAIKEQQLRYQQTEIELNNAKTVSMSAYQAAINSGRKESGAMLEATFAGAQQISDQTDQLIYTGVGLGISLVAHLSEKKAEKDARIMAVQKDNLRNKLIIESKNIFIKDLKNINKYNFNDLMNKKRYALLLILPRMLNENEQQLYFTLSTLIEPYTDKSYPAKEEILTKFLSCLPPDLKQNKNFIVLYPILNVDDFQKDFVKKIASGNIIKLNAQLRSFSKQPYNQHEPNGTISSETPSKKSFWDQ